MAYVGDSEEGEEFPGSGGTMPSLLARGGCAMTKP